MENREVLGDFHQSYSCVDKNLHELIYSATLRAFDCVFPQGEYSPKERERLKKILFLLVNVESYWLPNMMSETAAKGVMQLTGVAAKDVHNRRKKYNLLEHSSCPAPLQEPFLLRRFL